MSLLGICLLNESSVCVLAALPYISSSWWSPPWSNPDRVPQRTGLWMETSSHGLAPRAQPLLHEKTSDRKVTCTKITHTYTTRHICRFPRSYHQTLFFSSDEMSYAAGMQKSCNRPEIISYKTVYYIQSFLMVSCWFKPVVLWVTCCPVKTFIFTVFHPQ